MTTHAANHRQHPTITASVVLLMALLASCGGGDGAGSGGEQMPGVRIFEQATAPQKLSEWHLVHNEGGNLTLNTNVVPYDLNSALFSDYAFKLRALYVPPGKQIAYRVDGAFDFPAGSAIVKTFYYPRATGTDAQYTAVARQNQTVQGDAINLDTHHLVETRLLVRQSNGQWIGLPYVWDDDQKDATLELSGREVKLELVPSAGSSEKFTYAVPNVQACQQCHATQSAGGGALLPIGPVSRNLNKTYQYTVGATANQLTHLDDLKLLSGFPGLAGAQVNADWRDGTRSLDARAKAFLDVNCAHCHSPRGAAFETGLMLTFESVGTLGPPTTAWGVCKQPQTYRGPGSPYRFDIEPGRADLSLLLYRLSQTSKLDVMPLIGRAVDSIEANDLIRDWINQIALPACQ